jgi:hypothetical protein
MLILRLRSLLAGCAWTGLLLAVCFTAGCGSGGSGGGVITPTTRLVVVGDRLEYSVAGTVTGPGGADSTVLGHFEQTVEASTLDGQAVKSFVTSGEIIWEMVVLTLGGTVFVSQDVATHDIWLLGDDHSSTGAPRTAAAGTRHLPGAWSPVTGFSGTISFSDGKSRDRTFTVIGMESVTVPAGTFQAWKVRETIAEDGIQSTVTNWYVPSMGWFVKSDSVTTDAFATHRFVFSLQRSSLLP